MSSAVGRVACVILLVVGGGSIGCSSSSHGGPAQLQTDSGATNDATDDSAITDTSVEDSNSNVDTGAANDSTSDETTDSIAVDSTPIDTGVFDTGPLDGSFNPHPDSSVPLSACSSTPELDLSTDGLQPSAETPPIFATHYSNELAKSGGPLLVRLSGLDTNPLNASLSIGSIASGTFDPTAQGPATMTPTILAGTGHVDATNQSTFVMRIHTSAGAVDIPVVDVHVTGTISSDCSEVDDATITLFVPETAGDVVFDGETLSDQLADPDATVNGVRTWTIVLQGDLLPVGG